MSEVERGLVSTMGARQIAQFSETIIGAVCCYDHQASNKACRIAWDKPDALFGAEAGCCGLVERLSYYAQDQMCISGGVHYELDSDGK